MAKKRSSGGARGRDLFRTEVSSLVADLGELAGDEAPPPAGMTASPSEEPRPSSDGEAPLAPPDPPPAPAPQKQSGPATGHPPAGWDQQGRLELEDLPSFSPSYLPPLPPMLLPPLRADATPVPERWSPPRDREPSHRGEWLAAALAAGAAAPAAERPAVPPVKRHPVPLPEAWPQPPDPSHAGAGAETVAGELGAPDWQVPPQPAPPRFPDLAEMPGWDLETGSGPDSGQPLGPASAGASDQDPRSGTRPPSSSTTTAEPPGSPSGALSGPPPVTAPGLLARNQRLGLRLLPGGVPAPVSTRPWSLATAMKPVAPPAPAPGRAGGLPVSEPAGPAPARARGGGPALPFAAYAAILIAVLALVVVLLALHLHH